MTWIYPLTPGTGESADILGGKGHGLITLRRLGLPVPPGFVIGTPACRAFLRDGRFPDGLETELAAAVRTLENTTGRRFGSGGGRRFGSGGGRPLAVSVRSGAAVSMPGMMDTVLNLGLTTEATATVPDDAMGRLHAAVRTVFTSWHSPRATTYRELNGIPHDLGTAVVVQAMVFGDRDEHSGTGVAFSRDPNTGDKAPFGDVLFGRQGDDVVSGRSTPDPLSELAAREPAVWEQLVAALHQLERHYRDACHVEFTFETGALWFLQVRPGGLTGRAALRTAVDLADEHLIDRRTAVRRVSARHLQAARTPRIDTGDETDLLTRGRGACPGVVSGRIAVTADQAAHMAADGPVILVRPDTSPLDMHGLAAAAGVATSRGGPTSHAAVVARAMGKPAVVDAAALTVDTAADHVRIGERLLPAGTLITIDGTGGEIALGKPSITTETADTHLDRLLTWADELSGDHSQRPAEARLSAAHARL
ncbi:pyruvate, phosphate dikinase [Actinomadura sp. NAK00032]|uniref:PEP/pyruvate-binding domain-containing protein n=1 Tax=Actinomadura sp. NAK00032 TaxID=2742128 RepID=UPI0015904D63|nr:PEP/pyruvate-binding domain-containing protein [Actinomadura sp. NAK00032]QKW33159.1 pyruvate, phosphate dikinase [Actinomadura sp. NAK00032]